MADSWLHRFKTKIIIGLVLLLALSMLFSMLIVISMVRNSLLSESSENTRQLSNAICSSMRCNMINRSPEQIQGTLNNIGRSEQISKIFILNRLGQIDFSSDEREIGKKHDKTIDESCRGCHSSTNNIPTSKTIFQHRENGDIFRNVTVIYNEPACYGCHPKEQRINGKLIIDHPLAGTYSLINKIRLIILVSGILCLLLVVPFISKMINRYIDQIVLRNAEINLIYSIINSISKTIDMEELKNIVLDIVSDALTAEEVDLVLPKGKNGYRIISRSTNGQKYQRKKLEPKEPLADVVERWCNNGLKTQEFSADRTEVYLPIEKGESRLALIAIRCEGQPFPKEKLNLVEAICNHIAIAFENARLYSIAITDELTGLFTVRHFRFCIDRQMTEFERYGDKFAFLMIDIDNFKKVNDTYGHPTGDAVLKKVATCIAESIRGNDLAFRYGGEEFAVILPSTALEGGLHVAERIRSEVEAISIVENGQNINATVSIGLAICPDNALSIKDLILEADTSLYAAKKGGKNCTVASNSKLSRAAIWPATAPFPQNSDTPRHLQ